MNFSLALFLARRSLRHHRTVTLATVLGVAIGMTVVGAILIVDRNSVETPIPAGPAVILPNLPSTGDDSPAKRILRISFERASDARLFQPSASSFPTQEGQLRSGVTSEAPLPPRGEEDYQAMRLAVRLASLLAFAMGAVIVFYTMRFSVASRSRELSLLLCLGEERRNLALSLFLEATLQGLAGTLTGLLLAFPTAFALIDAGISTTGRMPASNLILPLGELAGMTLLSVVICLIGAAGPMRALYGMRIVDVLQPRFLSPGIDEGNLRVASFGWLLPPLMAAAYLSARPFLKTWLSVAQFFMLEVLFAGVLALAVLWWMTPLLRGVIRLAEWSLRPLLPLHTLLVGRRMRLTQPQAGVHRGRGNARVQLADRPARSHPGLKIRDSALVAGGADALRFSRAQSQTRKEIGRASQICGEPRSLSIPNVTKGHRGAAVSAGCGGRCQSLP